MKIIPIFFAVLLFFSGCASQKQLSPEEANTLMEVNEDVIILDVREHGEFDEAVMNGSILLPVSEIDKETVEQIIPSKDSYVFIFCHGENRSQNAYEILNSLGYKNVHDLGEITNWSYPYTKDIYTSARIDQRDKARSDIFPNATSFTKIRGYDFENVSEIYSVDDNEGLAITCHGEGYGGTITIIVGFNPDSSIKNLAVVDLSETAGLGMKSTEPSFLNSFIGFSGAQLKISDIDAISGATITSQAVVDAVNDAISALNELNFFNSRE